MNNLALSALGLVMLAGSVASAQQAAIRVWKSTNASGVPLVEVTTQPWVTIDNSTRTVRVDAEAAGDATPYWWIAVDDGNPGTAGATEEARTGDISSIVFRGVPAIGAANTAQKFLSYGQVYQVTIGKPAEVWPVVTNPADTEWLREIDLPIVDANFGLRHLGRFTVEGPQPDYSTIDPFVLHEDGTYSENESLLNIGSPFCRVRLRVGAFGDVGSLGAVLDHELRRSGDAERAAVYVLLPARGCWAVQQPLRRRGPWADDRTGRRVDG